MTRGVLVLALALSAGSVLAGLVMTTAALLWGEAPASPAGHLLLEWGPLAVLLCLAAGPGLGVLAAAAWVWLWMLHRRHDFRGGPGPHATARLATATGVIGLLCALVGMACLAIADAGNDPVHELLYPLSRVGFWAGLECGILCGGLATVSALVLRATRRSRGTAVTIGAAAGGAGLALGYTLSAFVSLGMLLISAIGPPD